MFFKLFKFQIDCRYLAPAEAAWRIFKFAMQQKSHSVLALPIHLEATQIAYFSPESTISDILKKKNHNMLTAYFLNNLIEKQTPLTLQRRTTDKGKVQPHGYELLYHVLVNCVFYNY